MKYRQPRNVSAPVKVRKRSDYAKHYDAPAAVVVPTAMESTELGSRSEGYKGEFEIEYELLARNVISPTFLHPKKERVLKVLEGSGSITLTKDGYGTTVSLIRGQDVVIPADTQYFLASTTPLYVMFIQPKSYKSRLLTLNEAKAPEQKELPVVRTVEEQNLRRRGSKAVEQQRRIAQARNERLGIREKPEQLGRAPSGPSMSAGGPMPSFGADLPGEPG